MEDVFKALETLGPIAALRFSQWPYAFINAGHILGLALLVGGIVPLSFRLFGFWSGVQRASIVRILTLSAGIGLGIALLSGALLFATRASEYASNPAFLVKTCLIAVGLGSAILAHFRYGRDLEGASHGTARQIAIVSCLCWIGALISGRMIAYIPTG